MSLETAALGLRTVIESAPELDAAVFARRARNAIARAVVAAASSSNVTLAPAERRPPLEKLQASVGPALAAELAAVYDGGEGWTRHAIDLLEPLHALASRAGGRPVGLSA